METEGLKEMIERSSGIVFFGGAGVSTESGIPDFRSEKGLYAAMESYGRPPEELLSHHFFISNPNVFFDYYKANLLHLDAEPNSAHHALALLEQKGKLAAVITQNIDGLHQAAGSRTVYELHGSVRRNYCMDCGMKYPVCYIQKPPNCVKDGVEGSVPYCKDCGGIVRPDVVLYEETLDQGVLAAAAAAIRRADLLLVGGTSLAVYPAAGLLRYRSRGKLVLINRTPTPCDREADLVIRGSIGQVLSDAAGL